MLKDSLNHLDYFQSKTSRMSLQRVQINSCDLYCKLMTIVNDDSRVMNKLEASLTDDARVVIYDHHMFLVQATGIL